MRLLIENYVHLDISEEEFLDGFEALDGSMEAFTPIEADLHSVMAETLGRYRLSVEGVIDSDYIVTQEGLRDVANGVLVRLTQLTELGIGRDSRVESYPKRFLTYRGFTCVSGPPISIPGLGKGFLAFTGDADTARRIGFRRLDDGMFQREVPLTEVGKWWKQELLARCDRVQYAIAYEVRGFYCARKIGDESKSLFSWSHILKKSDILDEARETRKAEVHPDEAWSHFSSI